MKRLSTVKVRWGILTSGLATLSGGVILLLSPVGGFAAQLEEVVVTAQKRAQSLQDVPVSVAAIGGEKMEDMGIMRMDDLTQSVPSVTVADGTGDDQLFIRGIGSGINKGFEQSVGTYIDGVYYGRGRSIRTGLMDLERVEVLKGPQGILFGKNTIAGALNITTRNPRPEFEGYVNLAYEFEHEEKVAEAAVSGPLTDTFSARLAVRRTELDGWMDNKFTGEDVQEQKDFITRLTTLWTPTESLEVITKLQFSELKLGERPEELVRCSAALPASVREVDDCKFNDTTTMHSVDPNGKTGGREDFDAMSAAVTVNWQVMDHTLTSVTGYVKHDDDFFFDADFTHLDRLSADRDEQFNAFSQELRITSPVGEKIEYIAGLYYETNELRVFNDFHLPAFGITRVSAPLKQDGDSMAAFGQVTWNIDEQWRLSVGGRYTEDEKDAEVNQFFARAKTRNQLPVNCVGALGCTFSLSDDRKDTEFSPSVTAEWIPHGDHMLYAKYSEGFKAGGFDLQLSSGDADEFEFDREQVESYEVGAKNTLLNGAMTLNVAVFRNEYTDLQVSTFDGTANFTVGNAAEAISQGIDLDLAWALTDELSLNAALSYLDAEYDKFPNAQCTHPQTAATPSGETCTQDLSGEELQYAPEFSGHVNLAWRKPIADRYQLTLSGDVTYSDDFAIANDLDPLMFQDSYYKLDARVAFGDIAGAWELALVGRNLNDEETFHWGNDVPLAPGSYFKRYDRTRTVALQGRYRF